MKHPARYSDQILGLIRDEHLLPDAGLVLDPFAGTGRIHELAELTLFDTSRLRTVGVEIEPAWAAAHPDTIVGDATALPFADDVFDAVFTSPTYGNRFADHHNALDGGHRRSYTHDMRSLTGDQTVKLHPNNTGAHHEGPAYWQLHQKVWTEVKRVLRPSGTLILNTSDFIRKGIVVNVTAGHLAILDHLGFSVVARHVVETPRMKYGQNHGARVGHEDVTVLSLPEQSDIVSCEVAT